MPRIKCKSVLQQNSEDCGVAAVYMVLNHYKIRKLYEDVYQGLMCTSMDGVNPAVMETYMRHSGLNVITGESHLGDIRHHLSEMRPVIVPTALRGGHYIVVTGVHGSTVTYNDPASGVEKMLASEFDMVWRDVTRSGHAFKRWLLTAWI